MVVTFVVVFNFALALVLLYMAWKVRQLQGRIARLAYSLNIYEQKTYKALHNAPNAIYLGKQGIKQLRQGQEPLQLQLQRARQVLILLGIGQKAWQRSKWRFSSPFLRKKAKTSLF